MICMHKSKMDKYTQEKTGFSSYAALLGGLESAAESIQSILADENNTVNAMRCTDSYAHDLAQAIYLICRVDAFIHTQEKV